MNDLGLFIVAVIFVIIIIKVLNHKSDQVKSLKSKSKSLSVKHGLVIEELIPFMKDLDYDKSDMHFLGKPIDYIIFEEDRIIFLEVKSGSSRLSKKQVNIKGLVEDGKVYWDEIRV